MNTLYPMFMKLEGRPVLVVGGGNVAEQKIKGLLDAKAEITVIAPQVSATIEKYYDEKKIALHRRLYKSDDVRGFFLVIGATDVKDVQQQIFSEAEQLHVPVNIVDVPHLCTFYLSSVFQKEDLKIAVSTNGKSPTLGKIIRDRIGAEFEHGYPELLETVGGIRMEVARAFPDFRSRKALFERLVRTELERFPPPVQKGRNPCNEPVLSAGKVFLVGAGPGDPELMTLKGLKILRSADVVLYDALVSEHLLALVPEDAEKIYVGKRGHRHCTKQEDIHDLLIAKASERKRIVRLKGGDPLVFGRGGEELEALAAAGIEVEIVPGITAGIGVPASLGIPLTHRGTASSIAFLTGHEDPAKGKESIDWQSAAHFDTIVVYMGVKKLSSIVKELIRHGVSPLKPAAVIYNGTLPGETVITGVLEDIEEQTRKCTPDNPGLIIVGDVVGFRDRCAPHEPSMQIAEFNVREYNA